MVGPYQECFSVSEEVSKVDMEEVSTSGHHDVVIVTITYALERERGREIEGGRRGEACCSTHKHVGSYGISST